MSSDLEKFRYEVGELLTRLLAGDDDLNTKLADALLGLALKAEFASLSDICDETQQNALNILGVQLPTSKSQIIERLNSLDKDRVQRLVATVVEAAFDVVDLSARIDMRSAYDLGEEAL